MDDMAKVMSEQAAALVREQIAMARQEMSGKFQEARVGAAMVGGAGALAALAAGTGTAALVLLLSRRPGSSAAALGVSGAYAAGGALLAREGIERLRHASPLVPETTVQNAKGSLSSKPKRRPRPKQAAGSARKRAGTTGKRAGSTAKRAGSAAKRAEPAARRRSSG